MKVLEEAKSRAFIASHDEFERQCSRSDNGKFTSLNDMVEKALEAGMTLEKLEIRE